jgi:hypothetical protein
LTRDDRVKVIVVLAVVTAILIIIADVWARSVGRSAHTGAGTATKGAHS